MNQKLNRIKEKKNNSTILVGTLVLIFHHLIDQLDKKMIGENIDLNNTINHLDIIDIYPALYLPVQYTPFSMYEMHPPKLTIYWAIKQHVSKD